MSPYDAVSSSPYDAVVRFPVATMTVLVCDLAMTVLVCELAMSFLVGALATTPPYDDAVESSHL
jgi:hypothetical protein